MTKRPEVIQAIYVEPSLLDKYPEVMEVVIYLRQHAPDLCIGGDKHFDTVKTDFERSVPNLVMSMVDSDRSPYCGGPEACLMIKEIPMFAH
jgi:hypothetical protein